MNKNLMSQNLERTDYDVNKVNDDPRFIFAKKEMVIIQIFIFAMIFVDVLICYGLTGNGKYFMGYPQWYAYATIFHFVYTIFVSFYVYKKFKRSKLDAVADSEEEVV